MSLYPWKDAGTFSLNHLPRIYVKMSEDMVLYPKFDGLSSISLLQGLLAYPLVQKPDGVATLSLEGHLEELEAR